MRHTPVIMVATGLSWAITGWYGLIPVKKPKEEKRQLSEQDKRELRLWGGDELLADTEQLMATAPQGDPIFSCLGDYMVAAKKEKDAPEKQNEAAIMMLN